MNGMGKINASKKVCKKVELHHEALQGAASQYSKTEKADMSSESESNGQIDEHCDGMKQTVKHSTIQLIPTPRLR